MMLSKVKYDIVPNGDSVVPIASPDRMLCLQNISMARIVVSRD